MDELKWMYAFISREEFQEKIAFAEKLLEKYGAEFNEILSKLSI